MNFRFEGRSAFVTGGRSGIGAACVRGLREHGARVFVVDRADLPANAEEDVDLRHAMADVTDDDAIRAAVRKAREFFGDIDYLVQCAGITRDGVLWKLSEADWRDVIDVNLTGAFHVMRAVAPSMRENGSGAIVNISSINGIRGKFGQANYAASKAGLIALTKTAARELGAFGIRVNAVAPGMVETPLTATLPPEVMEKAREESALGTICRPEDIAAAVLFLLSDAASKITGQTLRVDAGQTM